MEQIKNMTLTQLQHAYFEAVARKVKQYEAHKAWVKNHPERLKEYKRKYKEKLELAKKAQDEQVELENNINDAIVHKVDVEL